MTVVEEPDRSGSQDRSQRAVVEFCEVAKTYPGVWPVHAIRACSLSVEAGEFVTIVGPSGSGKSTLLNVLGLLDRPTAGTYRLNGVDVGALPERKRAGIRAGWLGFVFQSFHLIEHRSAADNVALGQLYAGVGWAERLDRAHQSLELLGLGHRAHAVPTQLSGGERQRVAIARALAHSPSVLLCDEPTGNIDQTSAATVLAAIDDLNNRGQTIVMITHDPEVAARGSRTFRIVDGTVSPA